MRPETIKVENTKLEIPKITPQQGCHSCESRNPVDYERFELVELVQSLPCTVMELGLCGEILPLSQFRPL